MNGGNDMVFVSPIFIFIFLPLTLICYGLAECSKTTWVKNLTLLVFSLVFYAWGGVGFLFLLLLSIVVNYTFGRMLEWEAHRKLVLILSIFYNVGILFVFKYFNFFMDTIRNAARFMDMNLSLTVPAITLPIGISFFTFQIMSYIFDVYKRRVNIQKNILDLALYIMLFPQLIAGPIVRYIDVNKEINDRYTDMDMIHDGIFRFMIGFNKKIFLANGMGYVADAIFYDVSFVNTPYAWLGAVCYALQIYMDFSSYSDMAIGLGKLFGFHFLENFDYPYLSSSIKEFWRRWHISLSSWFRDYVYIPLGGNRRGTWATYKNLLIVFILTGFWHGASWTFVIWGLFHGIFLIVERGRFGVLLSRLPKAVRHIYTMIVVLIGWVFFRCDRLTDALAYIKAMFVFDFSNMHYLGITEYLDREFYALLILSLLGSLPVIPALQKRFGKYEVLGYVADMGLLGLFAFAVFYMVGADFNPFIYFRF